MPEGERPPEDLPPTEPAPEERRVYPPHEVQARLQVSASGLRRLAGIFERTIGDLPRDERGRVWPEDAIEVLEDAREAVQSQRAVSIEAALRGQESPRASHSAGTSGVEPHTTGRGGLQAASPSVDVGAAILEELRALRTLVEEQNVRIAELEEAVRTGRELEASEGAEPTSDTETHSAGDPTPASPTPVASPEDDREPGPEAKPWQRVLAWFGFGVRRP